MEIYNTTTNEIVDIVPCDVVVGFNDDGEEMISSGDIVWNYLLERYESDTDTIAWWEDHYCSTKCAYNRFSELDDVQSTKAQELFIELYTEFNDAPCIMNMAIDRIYNENN